MKKPTPEAILTRQIRGILNAAGIYHWKAWQGLGSKRGVADILGINHDGRMIAIEVKTPRGHLSEHQQKFLAEINAHGGTAFCARSIGDVIEGLGLQDRFLPKTDLGKRLYALRNKAIEAGMKLLSEDEVLKELKQLRGDKRKCRENGWPVGIAKRNL